MGFFSWIKGWYLSIKKLSKHYKKWPMWKKIQFLDTFIIIGLLLVFVVYVTFCIIDN